VSTSTTAARPSGDRQKPRHTRAAAKLVSLQVERGQAKRYQLRQGAARHAGTVCRGRRSDESWLSDRGVLERRRRGLDGGCSRPSDVLRSWSDPHEAVAEVEQAVEAWLDAARAMGRLVPKPSSRVALA
jgi:hypothetical protein